MASIVVDIDEDIFDVANRIYGHPLGVHWLVEDNELPGINQAVLGGQLLQVREGKIALLTVKSSEEFRVVNIPDYAIDEYQSIFDVVMEKHGDIEGVFQMTNENGLDGITEYLWTDRRLKVPAIAYNVRVQKLLAPFMPIATIDALDKSDGIGFMYLERNFIIR